jgi:hypothetical protein
MESGTYRLSAARVADPDGGPPWSVARYRAETGSTSQNELVCTVTGRVLDGRLGMVTTRSTFLPIAPGGSPGTPCARAEPDHGEYASTGYQISAVPERVGVRCEQPTESGSGDACSIDRVRTAFSLSLGQGILGAAIQDRRGGRWTALPDAGEGSFLAVRRGLFSDQTTPTIRVRATICGAEGRRDLTPSATSISGCTITIDYPNDPRPARETAASLRAREAKRLEVPVRIAERKGTASIRRFTARLELPITVQKHTEGYAYRLTGPAGRGCRARRTVDTSWGPISNYGMIAGRTFGLPILPLDEARGVWCRGRYTLSLLFVEVRLRTFAKQIGTVTFTVR